MDYFGIVVIVSMHVGNEKDEEGIGFNKWLQKEIKLITDPTHDLKKDMDMNPYPMSSWMNFFGIVVIVLQIGCT